MGEIYTEITLKNVEDGVLARNGVIAPDKVTAAAARKAGFTRGA